MLFARTLNFLCFIVSPICPRFDESEESGRVVYLSPTAPLFILPENAGAETEKVTVVPSVNATLDIFMPNDEKTKTCLENVADLIATLEEVHGGRGGVGVRQFSVPEGFVTLNPSGCGTIIFRLRTEKNTACAKIPTLFFESTLPVKLSTPPESACAFTFVGDFGKTHKTTQFDFHDAQGSGRVQVTGMFGESAPYFSTDLDHLNEWNGVALPGVTTLTLPPASSVTVRAVAGQYYGFIPLAGMRRALVVATFGTGNESFVLEAAPSQRVTLTLTQTHLSPAGTVQVNHEGVVKIFSKVGEKFSFRPTSARTSSMYVSLRAVDRVPGGFVVSVDLEN